MDDSTIQKARDIIANFNADDDLDRVLLQGAYDLATEVVKWAEAGQTQAGTHAYDMLATYAKADANTTESLIYMVAATVLYKLIEEEGGGRSNISFSPKDMDDMFRNYTIDATRDGMLTVVRIAPREGSDHGKVADVGQMGEITQDTFKRLLVQDEDGSGAKPQAEAKVYDRPFWQVKTFNADGQPVSIDCSTRDVAEEVERIEIAEGHPAKVENRYCLHKECPAERCNHAEVTSTT